MPEVVDLHFPLPFLSLSALADEKNEDESRDKKKRKDSDRDRIRDRERSRNRDRDRFNNFARTLDSSFEEYLIFFAVQFMIVPTQTPIIWTNSRNLALCMVTLERLKFRNFSIQLKRLKLWIFIEAVDLYFPLTSLSLSVHFHFSLQMKKGRKSLGINRNEKIASEIDPAIEKGVEIATETATGSTTSLEHFTLFETFACNLQIR